MSDRRCSFVRIVDVCTDLEKLIGEIQKLIGSLDKPAAADTKKRVRNPRPRK